MWSQWCLHCLRYAASDTVHVMWTMMHSNSSHCMSPLIWQIIHRNVSEISIVSSWALTDVFHCEYQLWCQWISPFSSSLFTNSYLQGFLMSEPVCWLRSAADWLKISPITSSSSNSCRWLNVWVKICFHHTFFMLLLKTVGLSLSFFVLFSLHACLICVIMCVAEEKYLMKCHVRKGKNWKVRRLWVRI